MDLVSSPGTPVKRPKSTLSSPGGLGGSGLGGSGLVPLDEATIRKVVSDVVIEELKEPMEDLKRELNDALSEMNSQFKKATDRYLTCLEKKL